MAEADVAGSNSGFMFWVIAQPATDTKMATARLTAQVRRHFIEISMACIHSAE
jgi:hypothetical protein